MKFSLAWAAEVPQSARHELECGGRLQETVECTGRSRWRAQRAQKVVNCERGKRGEEAKEGERRRGRERPPPILQLRTGRRRGIFCFVYVWRADPCNWNGRFPPSRRPWLASRIVGGTGEPHTHSAQQDRLKEAHAPESEIGRASCRPISGGGNWTISTGGKGSLVFFVSAEAVAAAAAAAAAATEETQCEREKRAKGTCCLEAGGQLWDWRLEIEADGKARRQRERIDLQGRERERGS